MKHSSVFAYAIIFALIGEISLSVPAFSEVMLQGGGGIGYVIPTADYGGSTIDYYSGSKYGLSNGFNLQVKGRIGFGGFKVASEIEYAWLSNTGQSEPGQGKVDISQNVLSIKVGPEYQLHLPALPLTPYLGANLALNYFTGQTTFTGVASVPSGTFSLLPATRFGLGFSGGIIAKISSLMSFDIGLSYNLMNILGRSWQDINPAKDQRIDSYTALNDDKDPIALNAQEHFIGSARSIQSMQITAAILFGS